jgi:NADH:ubiquinone oxidoreductase subunit 6 (subunit J)
MVEKKELSKGVRIPLIFVTIVSAIVLALYAFMMYNSQLNKEKKMKQVTTYFVTSLLLLIAGILISTLTKNKEENKEEKKEENKEVEKD